MKSARSRPSAANRRDGRRNNKAPEHSKWKPGQSGNPSGRPKGSKSTGTMVKEILDQLVTVKICGKDNRIPFRKAMLLKAADNFMQRSDLRSLSYLLQLYEAATSKLQAQESRPEDREILEVFRKMIEEDKEGK